MDFTTVNVAIVLAVYSWAEILKVTIFKDDSKRTLLPVACIVSGAALGVLIYVLYPQGISTCTNAVDAFGLGAMSGASAIGCNQIYKQYTKFTTGADDSDSSST